MLHDTEHFWCATCSYFLPKPDPLSSVKTYYRESPGLGPGFRHSHRIQCKFAERRAEKTLKGALEAPLYRYTSMCWCHRAMLVSTVSFTRDGAGTNPALYLAVENPAFRSIKVCKATTSPANSLVLCPDGNYSVGTGSCYMACTRIIGQCYHFDKKTFQVWSCSSFSYWFQ